MRRSSWKPIKHAAKAAKVNKDVVGYSLRDQQGRRLYTGITNNPRARKAEHQIDGKKYAYMQIETEKMSRKDAEQWERRSLKGYHQRTGRLPKYNRNPTGQYQFRGRNAR